jgi:hypothetical protein
MVSYGKALWRWIVVVGIAVGDRAALGQERFRIVDVTEIGFTPDVFQPLHGTVAINNLGQIVYARDLEGDGDLRAWVYLPEGKFGVAAGIHDIDQLLTFCAGDPPPCACGPSAAWDINDSGVIVGQRCGDKEGQGEAILWQLGSPVTYCPLGTLLGPPSSNAWSVAFAINDQSPPVVVGDSHEDEPVCGSTNLAFRAILGTCPPVLEPLSPVGGNPSSYARAIQTPLDPGVEPLVAGFSWVPARPSLCIDPTDCTELKKPTTWRNPQDGGDQPATISSNAHEARGVNDAGNIVGWGKDPGGPPCRQRALYWHDEDVAAPEILALSDPTQQARADAINDRIPRQIVGTNISQGVALLWEGSPGAWTDGIDLNGEVNAPQWLLRQAHDVNDEGCIVGWGLLDTDGNQTFDQTHVFLLYEGCAADCAGAGDAVVGITDLLALLDAWGGPSPCDLAGPQGGPPDGMVGINDLLVLLGAWGPCCRAGAQSPPQSVQDCIDRYGYEDPLVLEHCICAVEPCEEGCPPSPGCQ